jgi:hypothetical protein
MYGLSAGHLLWGSVGFIYLVFMQLHVVPIYVPFNMLAECNERIDTGVVPLIKHNPEADANSRR